MSQVDIQGHRGCRGLMPENSIPAMIHAISLGVTTLEMDVVASADSQLVVSHEPWISAFICRTEDLQPENNNLFQMTYEEIRNVECGLRNHPSFREQASISTYKPLLSDLLDSTEVYAGKMGISLTYNIEIKSRVEWENIYQPSPSLMVDLLLELLSQKGLLKKSIIQSFDVRVLELIHQKHPDMALSYLTEKGRSVKRNLRKLSFTPQYYSPYHNLLSKRSIQYCHKKGVKVAPWTINQTKRAEKLVKWGVDAIITDYPNRMLKL